ncbi:fibroblast growth factor-binding protein 1 [Diretmus argenteus]
MALLTNLTILLVLASISHQLMASSLQQGPGRKGRAVGRGRDRGSRGLKEGRQSKSAAPMPIKGKLTTKDKSQCTWVAVGEDLVTLGVTCKKGGRSFSCEYVAKPSVCPQFVSNAQLYWKQIARALKKQKTLCQDKTALLKVGMCRKAPRDAHFRLNGAQMIAPPAPPPSHRPAGVKSCKADSKNIAEEYCSDTWSSLCMFFFTMVQTDDC